MKPTASISTLIATVSHALDVGNTLNIFNSGPRPISRLFTELALDFANSKFQLSTSDYLVKDNYRSGDTGLTHVYLQQIADGVEVTNGRINISINDEGRVQGFVQPKYADAGKWDTSDKGLIGAKQALEIFARRIGESININDVGESSTVTNQQERIILDNVPFARKHIVATRRYLRLDDNTMVPTWNLQVAMPTNHFDVEIAANGSSIYQLLDYTSNASYRVVPMGNNNPMETERELLVDPQDVKASPNGWLDTSQASNGVTKGNNAIACVASYEKLPNHRQKLICNPIPSSGNQVFDYPLDLTKEAAQYTNASVVNLFYMVNSLHDFFYAYGFDEISGNFQMDNFGKGGKGNDPIIAYTHGVTDRLVGGPSSGGCLALLGPAGIGEGSSDFVAMWLELKPTDKRDRAYEYEKYVYGVRARTYPYSTDMKVNPTTYALFNNDTWAESHKLGEIWASTLYDMHWNLPSFIDARDAILQAEKTLTKGAHNCELWKAFAKRGLGHGAMLNGTRDVVVAGTDMLTFIDNVIEDFKVPDNCR
ncbi:Fungalysin metallopeptidase-domain-containing protein [Syncephalis plumigaleata]|nr:Fungalysin metallopeptidase-domain-containing protein [Syncephalis plumigaleata]